MRERNFIAQNKDKWKELEEQLKEKKKNPDKLSRLFIQVTDDLSFARTYYPSRFVRVYLNALAQRLFYIIYKNQKSTISRFKYFWKEDLPRNIYEARKALLLSLVIFAIAITIGAVSTAHDPEFANAILGSNYVEQTLENISKNDPMAVYKKYNEVDMFLGISINNLRVSFLVFISGIFYCIGSIGLLIYNGIMIGVFQYFFYQHDLLFTSMVSIWLHGTLEISAIIIAAGAGITMGSGIIFPGTFTRTQSFFLSARRGIKILMGIVPIIVLAALIESYLTRYTEAPLFVKLILIGASFFFIVFYFVWYPLKKSKEVDSQADNDDGLHVVQELPYDFEAIHSNGMIFTEIFTLYKNNIGKLLRWSLTGAIACTVAAFLLIQNNYTLDFRLMMLIRLFDYEKFLGMYFVNTIVIAVMLFFWMRLVAKKSGSVEINVHSSLSRVLFFSAFINSFFFLSGWLSICLFIILGSFYFLWMSVSFKENKNLFSSFSKSFSLIDGALGKALGFFLIILLSAILFFFLINSPLISLYSQILKWNLSISAEYLQSYDILLAIFMTYFSFFLVLPLLVFGNFLEYFTLLEIDEGNGFIKKIRTLSTLR